MNHTPDYHSHLLRLKRMLEPATLDLPFRWEDRELPVDEELIYHRARYYDPTQGRWLAADPLGYDRFT